MMMAATVAFALQGIFVAASEAATGDTSHYYLGFAFGHRITAGITAISSRIGMPTE